MTKADLLCITYMLLDTELICWGSASVRTRNALHEVGAGLTPLTIILRISIGIEHQRELVNHNLTFFNLSQFHIFQ